MAVLGREQKGDTPSMSARQGAPDREESRERQWGEFGNRLGTEALCGKAGKVHDKEATNGTLTGS